ncbi:MAG: hypothetical protein C3F14_00500 [Deltaproteobacteria bacterium]|nr:MAG: hypothetical protein C3F14_00500 [Deltaproteobacteria bacterium]
MAGGGTGGTGISTGAISGFGSVVMDGTHFYTDDAVSPGFVTKKVARGQDHSKSRDRDLFSVGMVVSIHHSPADNNATEIEYAPNLTGPVASKSPGAEPVIVVLGRSVVVDNAALFASINTGNVVEISGFVDSFGRIRATFIESIRPVPAVGDTFETKGFLSGLSPSGNTFKLGSLPDGAGETVTVSCPPGAFGGFPAGPADGMYVQAVTTDAQPSGGMITAAVVNPFAARTDFPEGADVDLDALVTRIGSRSGSAVSFDLEGKAVRTDGNTVFVGGTADDIQPDKRAQVHGKMTGGVLQADKVLFR